MDSVFTIPYSGCISYIQERIPAMMNPTHNNTIIKGKVHSGNLRGSTMIETSSRITKAAAA
jgi:hypothetical protein